MRQGTSHLKSTKPPMKESDSFIILHRGNQNTTCLGVGGIIAIMANALKLVSWCLLTAGIVAVIMPLVILAYFIRILCMDIVTPMTRRY